MLTRVLIPLLSLLVAGAGAASDGRDVRVDVKSRFADQHARILAALEDGEGYAEISQAEISQTDKAAVRDALTRISATLAKAGSVDALSEQHKAQVFNDQELANSLLTRAGADGRRVCRREKTTGSHRAVTQCMTVAQRRRATETAQDDLRRTPRSLLENN